MHKTHKQYRLPNFDYSSKGAYFITVNCKNRAHFFGEIVGGEMYLSEIGVFVEENFISIKDKLKHLVIDEFVVMPDHIHFIAIINHEDKKEYQSVNGIQPLITKSISSFTNQIKGVIKKWCNNNSHPEFDWQSRFHDRIIRDNDEYHGIKIYIQNNVKNWKSDEIL